MRNRRRPRSKDGESAEASADGELNGEHRDEERPEGEAGESRRRPRRPRKPRYRYEVNPFTPKFEKYILTF